MASPHSHPPAGLRRRLLAAFAAIGFCLILAAVAGWFALSSAGAASAAGPIGSAVLAVSLSCLACSVLIVWLLIDRHAVRLTRVGDAITALASGRLYVPVHDRGSDEIAAMSWAVETLRATAIERDQRHAEQPPAERPEPPRPAPDPTAPWTLSEAALRVVFDSMSQGMAVFDRRHALISWNAALRDLLQLSDAFLRGRPSFGDFLRLLAWRGEFGPGDVEKMIHAARSDLDQPQLSERTRRDGTTFEIRRCPIAGGGFCLIYADVTERKRTEGALHRATQQAEAAQSELQAARANLPEVEKMAALGRLSADLVRDIKSPLDAVNRFAGVSLETLGAFRKVTAAALAALDADRQAEADELIALLSGSLQKTAELGRRAGHVRDSVWAHSEGGAPRQGVNPSQTDEPQ